MPNVPQVGLAKAPRVHPMGDAPGALRAGGSGEILSVVGDVVLDFFGKREEARDSQDLAERKAAFAIEMGRLDAEYLNEPGDPKDAPERFAGDARRAAEGIIKGASSRVTEAFREWSPGLIARHQVSAYQEAWDRERDAGRATFDADVVGGFVKAIAEAPNDAAREELRGALEEAIEESSLYEPAEKIDKLAKLDARIDLHEAKTIVFADPFEALERLEDPQDFPDLEPEDRLSLIEEASKEAERRTNHAEVDTEARFKDRSAKLTKSVLLTIDDPDQTFTTEQLRSIIPDLTLDHLKAISTKMRQGPIRVITDRTMLPIVRDLATSNDPQAEEKLNYLYGSGLLSEENWEDYLRLHANSQSALFKKYETRLRREILGSDFWVIDDGGDKDKRYGMAVGELQDFHESDARSKDYEAKHLELIEAYGEADSSGGASPEAPVQRRTTEEQRQMTFDKFKEYHRARLEENAAEESK